MIKKFFWGYTIILVLLAVLPINSSGNAINHSYVVRIRLDYLLHAAVFVPWMVMMRQYLKIEFKSHSWLTIGCIFAGLVFALANEAVQHVLPYRAYNINDLLANGLGVLMGAVVFWLPLLPGTKRNTSG